MQNSGKRFAFGAFLFDAGRGALSRDGNPVALGGRALLVLQALLEAQGEIVDKARLVEAGWPDLVVEESNLSVQIAALRKTIGTDPDGADWIVTVPRLGYRLVGAVRVDQKGPNADRDGVDDDQRAGVRPSVAVLPFVNLSDDPAQEFFVDGITQDIIAALTRFRWFFVAGRGPSPVHKSHSVDVKVAGAELGVRYLVQGSVRKAGPRIRIAVELVDAVSGHCLWAEHYDFELTDVFAIQDQIALRVAGSIEPELLKNETDIGLVRQHAGMATAWDLVAQGCWQFHQFSRERQLRARELIRQAQQLDPDLVDARIWLSRVDTGLLAFDWADDPDEVRREGMEAALAAIRMDRTNCYAYYALALANVYTESFAAALRAAEKAVSLSPSFALGHIALGMATLFSGDAPGAIPPFERGLELNRNDPHSFHWHNALALARLFGGDPDGAMQAALISLRVRPQWRAAMETIAGSRAAAGRVDEARRWIDQARAENKELGDGLRALWHANPGWAARMRGWLGSGT